MNSILCVWPPKKNSTGTIVTLLSTKVVLIYACKYFLNNFNINYRVTHTFCTDQQYYFV